MRGIAVLFVFLSLFLLGILLGVFMTWSPPAEQGEPAAPLEVRQMPNDESEKPVVLDIQNVPDEVPVVSIIPEIDTITPPLVVPQVEEQPIPEGIVQVIPPVEEQPIPVEVPAIPQLESEPAAEEQEVSEKPSILKPSYLLFHTGVPVRTVPVNVVIVPNTQWYVTPVFVQQAIPVRVGTYQYFYSTGFVYSTGIRTMPIVY